MRRTIEGKIYDTETATFIHSHSGTEFVVVQDLRVTESLYLSPGGTLFLTKQYESIHEPSLELINKEQGSAWLSVVNAPMEKYALAGIEVVEG